MRFIYFVGTAGSGKSSLIYAFQEWLTLQGLDSVIINLDPGVEHMPYQPDIDIRDWVRVDDVMEEYGLGPNGVQIVAADMMAVNAKDLAESVEKFRTNYVLVDTPGQIELFAFRQSSEVIMEELGKEDSCLVFLADPNLCKSPSGFVSSIMLAATVHFRFSVPFFTVLSKSDLLKEEELEVITGWSDSPDALYDALTGKIDSRAVLSIELFKALESIGAYRRVIPASATEPSGLEDIYDMVQESFEGGEDLSDD
ncbi:MAG TPA: ATP/GTP-binding protein [Methanomassiliicoccales archaeon]|nr:ATP/GTP-binding protein [Methanomassiliicoccales archaeon]